MLFSVMVGPISLATDREILWFLWTWSLFTALENTGKATLRETDYWIDRSYRTVK